MTTVLPLVLIIAVTLTGVSNLFAISQSAVLFLLISPGARAAGMGESFVAVADDATAVFWNPAGLAFQEGKEISFMHANWLPGLGAATSDIYYEFLAYKQYFPQLGGTLGGNVTFLNMGEMARTGEEGPDVLDTFSSWDLAVSLSYATRVTDNLGMGVTMRFIRSNLAPIGAGQEKGSGVASAFSADLSMMYKFSGKLEGLTFGANLSNMGPKITYVDASQADPLPTNLKLGFSYKALDTEYNKLRFSLETNKLLVHDDDDFYEALYSSWTEPNVFSTLITSAGIEYVYNKMIFLRTGYYYDEEGKVKYPTFGAGLMYSAYRFDFAYVAAEKGSPLSDTMRFSLTAMF